MNIETTTSNTTNDIFAHANHIKIAINANITTYKSARDSQSGGLLSSPFTGNSDAKSSFSLLAF